MRIEVANPHGDLRLGMYADVTIAAAGSASVVTVPKSSIQDVGSHQVVYVPAPNDPGTFIEREVQAGHSVGDSVEVVSGVNAGDSVVSEGSFFIRSEVERLGLRGAANRAAMTRQPTSQGGSAADVQTAKVVVGEEGYQPARITLRRGVPARITFLRTTDRTCGTEVVFPALDIRRALPLNQPVTIELTPARTEEIAFACGMNMLHGAVVVR